MLLTWLAVPIVKLALVASGAGLLGGLGAYLGLFDSQTAVLATCVATACFYFTMSKSPLNQVFIFVVLIAGAYVKGRIDEQATAQAQWDSKVAREVLRQRNIGQVALNAANRRAQLLEERAEQLQVEKDESDLQAALDRDAKRPALNKEAVDRIRRVK